MKHTKMDHTGRNMTGNSVPIFHLFFKGKFRLCMLHMMLPNELSNLLLLQHICGT